MGVVKGVPTDWSELETIDNLKSPLGKILKVRRLNRKITSEGKPEWIPTSSVVVTFDGQSLPERVFCFYNSLPVETYNYPTIQCFGCCKYGHTRTNCRSKPRCYRCGGDHFGDGCSVEEPKCFYCTGSHTAISKHCPEYIRQRNIKASMAKDNISYSEATKIHAPSFRSFADVTASSFPSQSIHQSLSQEPRPPRPPPPNYISHSQPSTSSSHKKIIVSRPKSQPSLHPGYDRRAHQDIINSFAFPPSPNGCALNDNPPTENDNAQTIQSIILLLSSVLSNYPLPDHVANNLIKTIKSHHIPSPTMEYQKCPPKKT
uniref:CCHC-type domain-containing protein n=1 Tax=Heliothis virescens TaxID=7102 RepID=A0A2A4JQD0_HELVI